MKNRFACLLFAAVTASRIAAAGEADVTGVRHERAVDGTYTFHVTVSHADTGWDHYADMWRVLAPDGFILGQRVLLHPHVDEQPFTRSLSGVKIADHIRAVTIRAHDKVHGWGGREMTVTLDR